MGEAKRRKKGFKDWNLLIQLDIIGDVFSSQELEMMTQVDVIVPSLSKEGFDVFFSYKNEADDWLVEGDPIAELMRTEIRRKLFTWFISPEGKFYLDVLDNGQFVAIGTSEGLASFMAQLEHAKK